MIYITHAGAAVIAYLIGAYMTWQPAYKSGEWAGTDGTDDTVIYCNISLDFYKLQLDRMAKRPIKPELYNTMFGKKQ